MEERNQRYEDLKEEYDLFGKIERELNLPVYEQPAPVLELEPQKKGLPLPVCLADIWKDPPKLAPQLIEGVLRQGHKMIISAPSKAGKSFALMELAFAIAEGMNWFGSRCRQGRVLYINMEIDAPSCYNRFKAVYDGFGMGNSENVDNITVWNLRGHSRKLSDLTPDIIETAGKNYVAIIIDPLYKVLDGDENSNSEVAQMVANFDKIAQETGASVIYAHHFAKGVGGDRDAIDRGAGAGTFARDPDAILTMVQLDMKDPADTAASAWRIEYVLREFPNKDPVSFWWRYPIHQISDALDEVQTETTETKRERRRRQGVKAKRQKQISDTEEAVDMIADSEGKFTLTKFIKAFSEMQGEDIPRSTAQRRLEAAGYKSLGAQKNGLPSYWKKET